MSVKILIVDDEATFRLGIRCYLSDEGFTVIEASQGLAALEAFDTDKPDIVLLDVRMPGMSGLDVLRELRTRSAEVPVVMVSGAGDISDVVQSMHLGASDFVFKPILDFRILLETIHKGLDRLRLIRENQRYHLELEKMVADRTAQLGEANQALHRKTIALEEILAAYQADTTRRSARIVERIDQFVRPVLEQAASTLRQELLNQFDIALADATSDSLDRMSQKLSALTPSELRVCEMIRRGMGTKDIAASTGISSDTVETHRRNIRRKLRINNETVNLSTYLRQLLEENGV